MQRQSRALDVGPRARRWKSVAILRATVLMATLFVGCGGAQPRLADPETAPTQTPNRIDRVGAQAGAETGAAREQPTELPSIQHVLEETQWQWIRFVDPVAGSLDVLDPHLYTLHFEGDGALSVRSDCNEGRGTYLIDQNDLAVRLEEVTTDDCGAGSLSLEFFDTVASTERFARSGDRLLLFVRWGTGRLEFLPAETPPRGSI